MRRIYIDRPVENTPLKGVFSLSSKEEIQNLYGEKLSRMDAPPLVMDCRELNEREFTMLLKFIEEYRGDITIIARDPVPQPILSRFTEIFKNPEVVGGSLLNKRLSRTPFSLRDRVEKMFGIKFPGEEEEAVDE